MIDKKLVGMLYEKGHGYTEIANIIGVSKQRIHQIIANYKNTGIERLRKKDRGKLPNDCQICYEPAKHLHHIDKNNANDNIKNLLPLCLKCHKQIHKGDKRMNKYTRLGIIPFSKTKEYYRKRYPLKPRFEWSFKYEKCQSCNLTNSPHAGKGYCKNCYMKSLYKNSEKYKEARRKYQHSEKYKNYHKEYYSKHYSNNESIKKKRHEYYMKRKLSSAK